MTIASALADLNTDIQNARTAVTNKGGTVTVDGGSSQLATDIGTITELKGETKTINPSTTTQTITPSAGKNGITSATVNPVTSDIDANIQAGNIKKDVQILGVIGTFEGSVGIARAIENGEFKTGAESWEFPSGVTSIGSYACYYGQYNNTKLKTVSGCENITEVANYGFAYCFSDNTSLNSVFDFSKLETVGERGFYYGWRNCTSQTRKFDFSGVKTVENYGFAYAFNYQNRYKNIDIRNVETAGNYAFNSAFSNPSYDSYAGITVSKFEKLKSVGTNCFSNAFSQSNPDNVQFLALESITAANAFANCWSACNSSNTHKIWHPFPVLKSIEANSVFSNACTYFYGKALIFDSLETVNISGNRYSAFFRILEYSFMRAASGEDNKVTGLFAFPCLKTIGSTSATNYSNFGNAAENSNSSAYFDGPELETINNYSSTNSRGQFSSCGFIRVYMPKLTEMNGYPQYVFYNSTTVTELHFGKENQATIEALNGYSSKFGASNATIYFDLINHITVNGVVYDRYGKAYDYDTAHFSWKNGDDIIYTTEEWTPEVGDATYTKSGDSYVSTGQTITAVA